MNRPERAAVAAQRRDIAQRMRTSGKTWTEIGTHLGVSAARALQIANGRPRDRYQIVDHIAHRHGLTKLTASQLLDTVLDEVIAMAWPKLSNDWTGGEVLHVLKTWRGERP